MPEDPRKAAHRVDANRFWAVLVGINAYPSSPLRGCVSDVKKMEEFLTKDLEVPEGHIQLCIEPEERRIVGAVTSPIRENIVNTLLGLSTNPDIKHGDNIIIYFSGHGTSYNLSDFDKSGDISAEGSIEALCPLDRNFPSGTDTSIPDNLTVLFQSLRHNFGTQGVLRFCFDLWRFLMYCIHIPSATDISIPDISDREINNILAEISRAKGNHITLILDCCHSSGASRDPSEPLNAIRRAPSLPASSIKDMLEAAHTRLGNLSKYRSVFEKNWQPDMTSHVVLAACTDTQHAKEEEGADKSCNGIFTQALIKALKSDDLKEESTYVDLVRASKMPPEAKQTPIVAGNMEARLWYQSDRSAVPDSDLATVTTPTPQPKMCKVSSWPDMNAWLLSVVGVSVGIGIGLIAWLCG